MQLLESKNSSCAVMMITNRYIPSTDWNAVLGSDASYLLPSISPHTTHHHRHRDDLADVIPHIG